MRWLSIYALILGISGDIMHMQQQQTYAVTLLGMRKYLRQELLTQRTSKTHIEGRTQAEVQGMYTKASFLKAI